MKWSLICAICFVCANAAFSQVGDSTQVIPVTPPPSLPTETQPPQTSPKKTGHTDAPLTDQGISEEWLSNHNKALSKILESILFHIYTKDRASAIIQSIEQHPGSWLEKADYKTNAIGKFLSELTSEKKMMPKQ